MIDYLFAEQIQRQLLHDVPSFRLVPWHKDALRHGIVQSVVECGAMRPFLYAVEAVGRHLIGRYEDRLSLPLRPFVETLIVEMLCTVIYVCSLVGNVAIYHAVLGYLHLGIVKHTACDGQILPP